MLHHIGNQVLVDPVYTISKLQYPEILNMRIPNPEQPARVVACYEGLQAFGLVGEGSGQLRLLTPRPATLPELALVHSEEYIQRVIGLSQTGGDLGESTFVGPGVFKWAALAAGAGLTALEAIAAGQLDNAFVLARPPGHHARRDQAAGFCVFNNLAITARHCARFGWSRVLIIDWDLHHGDGTQQLFNPDPGGLFCSLHQFGPELYPEKGDWSEIGEGVGRGYTVNLPLPAKTGEADYLALFEKVVPALAEYYKPDIILVSAGYDGHFNDTQNPYVWDPGGGLSLSSQLYNRLTGIIADCARRYCEGRYVVMLEGGYNLYCLVAGVVNTVAGMLDLAPLITEIVPASIPINQLDINAYLQKLKQFHPFLDL